MADITLVNMNMLYVRYYDQVEREYHVPLGTLYLTRVLEDAGVVDSGGQGLYRVLEGMLQVEGGARRPRDERSRAPTTDRCETHCPTGRL